MELLSRLGKGLLIGSVVGIGVALFTTFLFRPLIERLELKTYDMRYVWKFQDEFKDSSQLADNAGYGVGIIDIDDRSLEKLGTYSNWDRSYHAQLLEALNPQSPAAVVFDILFADPEDGNHVRRLQRLFASMDSRNTSTSGMTEIQDRLASHVDYDRQFADAARRTGNVFFGINMANLSDYPEYGRSRIMHKTVLSRHDSLNPSSAIRVDSTILAGIPRGYRKPILDGIFPELARSGQNIGFVNMVPDDDGIFRKSPVAMSFGDRPILYLPLSIRTVATLFGTPEEEIIIRPGEYVDLGHPFSATGGIGGEPVFSYPNVTAAQVKELLRHSERIISLGSGEVMTVSAWTGIGLNNEGKRHIEMYCGVFPSEITEAIISVADSVLEAIQPGDTAWIDGRIKIYGSGPGEYTLIAPFGDEEYLLSSLDLRMLTAIDQSDFGGLAPGQSRLLFHDLTVRNKGGELISSIPVLRGATLIQLCRTPWRAIADLPNGVRMKFGQSVKIPLNRHNEFNVTFFGPRARPFKYYSYCDIMSRRVQGGLDGKILVVGSTASGLFDIKPVPHDNYFPGVEIHASVIASLLTNTFVRRLSFWESMLILIAVSVVIGFVAVMFKPLPGALLSLTAVFGFFVAAMTLFGTHHLWIEITRPVFAIIATFTAAMAYRYVTEEKDRKFLQKTFKQYLSPELIDIMYKQKEIPELGGEEGIRTAFFTDIQGFSTFSEKLGSPTRLVELLNEYLSAMTDILLAHYGTLDKYEGDAIIAFFGAPMPMQDHARQACLTALDMQDKLGQLRGKWVAEGDKWPRIVHEMRMRIGINSGTIMTGNMGSKIRMNYTMMGDAVNLAARLESAAKQYGVYTMISHYTHDLVQGEFAVRQLDKITVVGKSEPVVVYELLARHDDVSPGLSKLVSLYSEGLALFYDRQWDRAIEVLQESERLEPYREINQKNPSRKIIDYCREFKLKPPGSDWDGVIRLTSK